MSEQLIETIRLQQLQIEALTIQIAGMKEEFYSTCKCCKQELSRFDLMKCNTCEGTICLTCVHPESTSIYVCPGCM